MLKSNRKQLKNGRKIKSGAEEPALLDTGSSLVLVRPRNPTVYTSDSRTVLAAAPDGFVSDETEHGLWVYQCRMLSRYQWLINGAAPMVAGNSNVDQHSWLGYYIAPPPQKKRKASSAEEYSIELQVSRQVGPGLHEDVTLTNFTQKTVSINLQLEVDADFLDPKEVNGRKKQRGHLKSHFHVRSRGTAELSFDYRASHRYSHQGDSGTARISRGIRLSLESDSRARFRKRRISFALRLKPHEKWEACLKWCPRIEKQEFTVDTGCHLAGGDAREHKRDEFLRSSSAVTTGHSSGMSASVAATVERSRRDLASLRLYDLDKEDGQRGWTLAAGVPAYVALFGRDSLMSSWQALMLSPDMSAGTLRELSHWQASQFDDWRDMQPGKIVHELQTKPLSALNFNPHGRYFGSVTGAIYFGIALAGLWQWTGDKALVKPLLKTALRGLEWADKYGDIDGDGFCEYLTRSEQGEKNQGWKDSDDAIVYEDGQQVPDPLGTCEMQGFIYASKMQMAEMLLWLDEPELSTKLVTQATELKKRFNDAFWMPEKSYIAMGLDAKKRQIKSIASDPGHCVTSGIVDTALVKKVAQRMMAPDMFSGWGVRTLSAEHPAFDPYAYHRGTVWPVENATFALGFSRYGLHELSHRLSRAHFEAAALFQHHRPPEVFAGHQRDPQHPFPGLYPTASWPQAWSASASFTHLQAMLGLYPYAPMNVLLMDPRLPEWLPEVTIEKLRVGAAHVTIRFFREKNGRTDYEVLEKRGELHLLRQPSPWSLTSGWGERVRDVIASLLPHAA